MTARVWRTSGYYRNMGIVAVLFCTYFLLHAAGIVPWKISPVQTEITFANNPTEIRLLIGLTIGCVLVLLVARRLTVTVDETGLQFQGVVRSVYMRWENITRVSTPRRFIHVWVDQRRMEIPTQFFPQPDLKIVITEHVKRNNPDAVIDESPLPFWPWTRS